MLAQTFHNHTIMMMLISYPQTTREERSSTSANIPHPNSGEVIRFSTPRLKENDSPLGSYQLINHSHINATRFMKKNQLTDQ